MRYQPQPYQPELFPPSYKYIIDANIVFAQNPSPQPYPRDVWPGMWELIDELVKSKEIVTCRQVSREIHPSGDRASQWFEKIGIHVLQEIKPIQDLVVRIVNENPNMLKFSNRASSSADPFIIASAIHHDLVIVTQESKNSPRKIPQIAAKYGVESVNISELCEREGWKF